MEEQVMVALTSVAQLARDMGLNRASVRRALRELQAAGYISLTRSGAASAVYFHSPILEPGERR